METMYGYICVSAKRTPEPRQQEALSAYPLSQVYSDSVTETNPNRPAFDALCAVLLPKDVVVVQTVGILGADYDEILQRWGFLTKEKGAHIVVQDMPLLDTRLTDSTVQGVALSELILQILAYAKRVDRADAKVRQAEGISAAKERGVRFGRPPQERPALFWELKRQYEHKQISARAAAKQLNVTHKTFISWVEAEPPSEDSSPTAT